MIQDKQLEHSLKLSKQTTIKIDNKTYNKKSLSAKQWREIVSLNQEMVAAKTDLQRTDLLIKMREKGALYYFGIPPAVFDENYEKVYPVIEGCIIRSNSGLSSEIDLNAMLEKFQNEQQQSSSLNQSVAVPHSNSMTLTPPTTPEQLTGVLNVSSSHKKVKTKK